MDTIYLKVKEQLEANVPELRWIDIEMGQLEFHDNPPVLFPCALIDIDLPQCEDNFDGEQRVIARVTIRYAFQPLGNTNSKAPESVQAKGLEHWATVKKGYSCLQGFGDDEISLFSRKSQTTELRDDPLKVIRQIWETVFDESV